MTAWPTLPLSEVGTWYGGGTPSKSRADFWTMGDIPWVSPKDMAGDVLRGSQDHITEAAVEQSAVRLVPANSVAIVVRSGILERTLPIALVPFETTLNQDMKAVVPNENIDPRWVLWALRSAEHQLLTTTRKAGTTVASIETSRLLAHRIPLVPLAEQRRIVEILEDHLSRLDAADRALTTAQQRASNLVKSDAFQVVLAAESNPAIAKVKLSELAKIGTGATPLRGNAEYWEGGTVPWITSGDLSQGLIASASQYVTHEALKKTSVKLWPEGTLLVAMYGEGKTRGTVGELAISATTNQACAAILLHDATATHRSWLRLILSARYESMRRASSGGVQPNLNLGVFRDMEVPWPAESVAAAAVETHREIAFSSDRAKDSIHVHQARSARLRRAILSAAFSGKLTGRRTNDEVVEELAEAMV